MGRSSFRLICSMLLAALSAGCGAEDETSEVHPPATCEPPNRLVADRCLEPGMQHSGCLAGELTVDGGCLPAGLSPGLCAVGFEPVDGGCEPILPAAPCPPGEMAVPGEASCRPVMACPTGRWGEIPVDGTTVYVDGAYVGGNSDGSSASPWTTISEAVTAAPPNTLIAVAEGSYVEDVTIAGKLLRLWGVCPQKVEIVGSASGSAIIIRANAHGTEVHDLALRGDSIGLLLTGSEGVLLDRVWIHDNAHRGIDVENFLGATSVTISRSLVESNHDIGVFFLGSAATIEATVIRATQPLASNPASGRGIDIEYDTEGATRSNVTVLSSVVEQNHDIGVYAAGSDVSFEASVARGTLPRATDQRFGRGLNFEHEATSETRSNATVRSSVVEQNLDFGVFVGGSDATIEGLVVRSTSSRQYDQTQGVGLGIQHALEVPLRPNAFVRSSLLEHNRSAGLFVAGGDVTIEAVWVRDTMAETANELYGRGINIQDDFAFEARANVTLLACLVERNRDIGVLVADSDAVIEGTAVRDTAARSDGLFGDGVVVITEGSFASTVLGSSVVERNARAGLGAFGATASLQSSAIRCNDIDLATETYLSNTALLQDLGGNLCGCDDPAGTCAALSAGIEPPQELPQ